MFYEKPIGSQLSIKKLPIAMLFIPIDVL